MENKFNLLIKKNKDYEYFIVDFIATKLSEKQFEKIKKCNEFLKDYDFLVFEDTEFTWWSKVDKYLTMTKLYKNQCFDIDFYGNVLKY